MQPPPCKSILALSSPREYPWAASCPLRIWSLGRQASTPTLGCPLLETPAKWALPLWVMATRACSSPVGAISSLSFPLGSFSSSGACAFVGTLFCPHFVLLCRGGAGGNLHLAVGGVTLVRAAPSGQISFPVAGSRVTLGSDTLIAMLESGGLSLSLSLSLSLLPSPSLFVRCCSLIHSLSLSLSCPCTDLLLSS